ncbi:F-box/kelch-repeat protein At2g44130-like [Humulus lupulus]|uniref:F-box/kelch-repeat protein At2g44130-like n=1 Tax=Humulus lupulus TaxID=3486 RepID=UPI002B40B245|nr:F-box/kelch-repeat protein At2g44130-like [Humulus lupulus]
MEDSQSYDFSQLIPGLPDELGFECLTRLQYTTHCVASRVCHRWRALIQSSEFHRYRKSKGYTHKLACLVQALPRLDNNESSLTQIASPKRSESPSFGLVAFDATEATWRRIDPVPKYADGLPMFCHVAGCDGKLVVMGGWDPKSYGPVSDVFVFDFAKNRWSEGSPMPTKRSFFAAGSYSGRIYVAGGHDENKNALSSAWVYDLSRDEWTELPPMSQGRDECESAVVNGEFWVVSGYGTDSQGAFESSAEVYNIATGNWRRVECVWPEGECPRGRVGVWKEKEGKFSNWAELDLAVRIGTCWVGLDFRALVMGSDYQGGAHGFFMVESIGQKGKLENITVPAEFSGSVQSACCVEI